MPLLFTVKGTFLLELSKALKVSLSWAISTCTSSSHDILPLMLLGKSFSSCPWGHISYLWKLLPYGVLYVYILGSSEPDTSFCYLSSTLKFRSHVSADNLQFYITCDIFNDCTWHALSWATKLFTTSPLPSTQLLLNNRWEHRKCTFFYFSPWFGQSIFFYFLYP